MTGQNVMGSDAKTLQDNTCRSPIGTRRRVRARRTIDGPERESVAIERSGRRVFKTTSVDMGASKVTVESVNQAVVRAEYAVRGPIVAKAREIELELAECAKNGKPSPYGFDKVVYCNIGNPQQLGQKPMTFFRQVSAALDWEGLTQNGACAAFPSDVLTRVKNLRENISGGTGAYSESKGVRCLREAVAKGITARDGFEANVEDIYLTDGASAGCHYLMNVLIRDDTDAVLCPIPQYPLYSAALTLYGGTLVPYYMDEETGWSLNLDHLKKQTEDARAAGKNVRALVVINPGNPTGNLLSDENLLEIAQFCADEGIIIISDEVYQENIYAEGKTFKSMRKVVFEAGLDSRVPLASFHSISKGYYGECGRRGGFMELVGAWDAGVVEQILKLASIALCPNLVGQVTTSLVMDPPVEGEPSYELYAKERDDILSSLARRAKKLVSTLNTLEGVVCQEAQGAMYAFPNLTFPQKYLDECTAAGKVADTEYCTRLLLKTGIVTVPGSGFGQKPGTWHFRTTFLPSEEDIETVTVQLCDFHREFMAQYK